MEQMWNIKWLLFLPFRPISFCPIPFCLITFSPIQILPCILGAKCGIGWKEIRWNVIVLNEIGQLEIGRYGILQIGGTLCSAISRTEWDWAKREDSNCTICRCVSCALSMPVRVDDCGLLNNYQTVYCVCDFNFVVRPICKREAKLTKLWNENRFTKMKIRNTVYWNVINSETSRDNKDAEMRMFNSISFSCQITTSLDTSVWHFRIGSL